MHIFTLGFHPNLTSNMFSMPKLWLWLGTSLFNNKFFLHNKGILLFCFILSYSGHFYLTSTVSTTCFTSGTAGDQRWAAHSFILMQAASSGMFFLFLCSPKGFARPPTLLKASNITSNEYILINYHLKC